MSAHADLIERLRTVKLLSQRNQLALQSEAAAAIAKLEAERDALREALARGRYFQHVAYFDDGKFEWMSGIRPRDCELYAHPLPTHTPAGN